jgi:hypothetical protein
VAINDDILVQSVSNAVTNASLSSIDYSHRPSIISATFSGINYDTRSLANFTNMNSIEASQLLTSGLQRIGYAKPGKILFMDSSWTSQPSVAAVHSAQSNSVMYIQNIGPIVFSANQAGISVICQQSQIYLFGFERTSPASAKIAVTIGNCDFGSIQPLGF